MNKKDRELADGMTWWHRIPLASDYTTNGKCDHGNTGDFESRFGLPASFKDLTVLDVGGYDGLFSFEAEKRGAEFIDMIDMYQYSKCSVEANRPFQLAKDVLNSAVNFQFNTIEKYEPMEWKPYAFCETLRKYDAILYFGVLYHVKNPLEHIEKLMNLVKPGGTILVETAISGPSLYLNSTPILEYRPDFDNDPTNFFYPNKAWLETAFRRYGAKSIEVVYNDAHRGTFRILC